MTTKKKRSAQTDNDSWVVIAPGTFTKFTLCSMLSSHLYFEKSCIQFSLHIFFSFLFFFTVCDFIIV